MPNGNSTTPPIIKTLAQNLALIDTHSATWQSNPLVAGAWTERKKISAEKVTFPHFLNGHFQCPKQKSETTFQYKYTPY